MSSISTENVTEVAGGMDSMTITWLARINGWLGLWLVTPLFVVGSSGIQLWNDVIVGTIISLILATTGVLVTSVLAPCTPGRRIQPSAGRHSSGASIIAFRYVSYN